MTQKDTRYKKVSSERNKLFWGLTIAGIGVAAVFLARSYAVSVPQNLIIQSPAVSGLEKTSNFFLRSQTVKFVISDYKWSLSGIVGAYERELQATNWQIQKQDSAPISERSLTLQAVKGEDRISIVFTRKEGARVAVEINYSR